MERRIYPNIEAERVRKGLKREELVEKIGISLSTYYNWLAGRTAIPSTSLKMMARIFEVTTDYDMENIIGSAMWYVSYHTTYCNALNMWIAGCGTAEEVQEIFYGAGVPEEYRSEVLNAYLIQIAEMAGGKGDEETA